MLFFLFINVKIPTIIGILTFMSRKILAQLSWAWILLLQPRDLDVSIHLNLIHSYVCWQKRRLHCYLIAVSFFKEVPPVSNLNTTLNISPPNLLASHLFFSTASFRESHLNWASRLVCIARPIPSMTIKSAFSDLILATKSLSMYLKYDQNQYVRKAELQYKSTLCRLDILKGVLWQTVQTQIRCHIMWHLIRIYIVC